MKKILFLIGLCITTFSFALTKDDLEKAIRSLDVASVQQIIAHEKFTPREYNRYLDLAEEVVRSREIWVMKLYTGNDVTTPYEEPSVDSCLIKFFGSIALFIYSGALGGFDEPEKSSTTRKIIGLTGMVSSFALLFNAIGDSFKIEKVSVEHIKLLRKKYDDAVTIKQLIYMANIIEA